jgi:hypothetical protein
MAISLNFRSILYQPEPIVMPSQIRFDKDMIIPLQAFKAITKRKPSFNESGGPIYGLTATTDLIVFNNAFFKEYD